MLGHAQSRLPAARHGHTLSLRALSSWEKGLLGMTGRSRWDKALSGAEQVVGAPTSFASMRSLMGDEISTLASYARRLIGSSHPFLNTARACLLGDGDGERQVRGMIVLLISKALHASTLATAGAKGASEPITAKQRALAEITELIFTATEIHDGVLDLSKQISAAQSTSSKSLSSNSTSKAPIAPPAQAASSSTSSLLSSLFAGESGSAGEAVAPPAPDLVFGNKMAVLGGDFLLAHACTALARLHHVEVVESMSEAISDIMEGQFFRTPDAPLADIDKYWTASDWEGHARLLTGSLISRSCECAGLLGKHDNQLVTQAAQFGMYFALATQLLQEMRIFKSGSIHSLHKNPTLFSTLPVILAARRGESARVYGDISALLLKGYRGTEALSLREYEQLRQVVTRGGALTETAEHLAKYCSLARDALAPLPSSDAKTSLLAMVDVLSVVE